MSETHTYSYCKSMGRAVHALWAVALVLLGAALAREERVVESMRPPLRRGSRTGCCDKTPAELGVPPPPGIALAPDHPYSTPPAASAAALQQLRIGRTPKAWDWRQHAPLTELGNQFLPVWCGSCWSFGTTSVLSDRLRIRGHLNGTRLSPQVRCAIPAALSAPLALSGARRALRQMRGTLALQPSLVPLLPLPLRRSMATASLTPVHARRSCLTAAQNTALALAMAETWSLRTSSLHSTASQT